MQPAIPLGDAYVYVDQCGVITRSRASRQSNY